MDAPDPISRLNAALEGRYRIERELGEGGMGTVYLAEQTEPVVRRVAIKVLRDVADSTEVVARFDAERQALAMMDHPSIAKVYDAGVTDDGLPFFVMEFVEGTSLAAFCDANRLSVSERVALFAELCNAVQHAHQKGVIHRDLKPSNVLVSEVDGRPLPRVIDFGIAKATHEGVFDGTQLTRDDEAIGTPAYMSPEQIDGSEDVDTRTDLYALGVMLFEILLGALPFEKAAYRGWLAVATQMQREPPTLVGRLAELGDTQQTLASLRSTTVPRLRSELSGDLGWIVSRAMEKNRERRYETASGMALDLRRFLNHEPVRARGTTTPYLVSKFVRRNRLWVGVGATAAVGLMVFAVFASIQADRIAQARDEAEARRGQAEGLVDFMLTDLREKLEPIGRTEILTDVGDQALAYFASLPEGEFTESELLSRSQALYQIGSVRLNQGSLREAEIAFAQSLRLARELVARDPENTERLFGQSQSHFWVGYAAWLQRDLETAEAEFEGYLRLAELLVDHDSANADWRLELAYAHSNLGSVREERRDLRGALRGFEIVLDIKQHLAQSRPDDPSQQLEVARGHNKVGQVLQKLGDLDGAHRHYVQDLELTTVLTEDDPANAIWAEAHGLSHMFVANVLLLQGDVAGALERYRSQERSFERLVLLDPENADWPSSLAIARRGIGRALMAQARYAEAADYVNSSRSLFEALATRDPARVRFARGVALGEWATASILLETGQPRPALDHVRRSIEGLEAILARDAEDQGVGLWLGEGYLLEGVLLTRLGDPDAARVAWEEAFTYTESGTTGLTQSDVLDVRARLLLHLGREDEARGLVAHLSERGYSSPGLVLVSEQLGTP